MQDDAQSLVGRDESTDAKKPFDRGKNSPPPAYVGQNEEDGEHEAQGGMKNALDSNEKDAGLVPVADAPANEAGMRLVPESGLDHVHGRCES